ncbi:VWA domain-containing protein [Haloarcula onubensis]|uniref:VWA domain-containing protein n=1 Tax=Haloarcula onubensis TaxID=2950539 RepID=A0ABU2FR08_9EURY|nr:VWA domain-containing protein [Halomicroarcula sp. S3CR25-11]MDS0283199.1 VWA domain-containing protein [Halomicroarcula sp. S3CR25-11]
MTEDTASDRTYRIGATRRRFISTIAAGGALAVGQAAAQSDDDSAGGGSAVNVGTGDTIENADEVTFDERIPVGELAQLFIEFDTPAHPVVGTDIELNAVVLNAVRSDGERAAVGSNTDLTEFEWEGDRILSPLLEPTSWVAGSAVSLDDEFYEEHQLVRLAGTAQQDQRFYDRYGTVPTVWAVAPASERVEPGTTVTVVGTVDYAGREDSAVDFGGGRGVYLNTSRVRRGAERTTIDSSTTSGERASFLGTQLRSRARLTTELANLDYSYETEYPRPAGGSVVAHEGTTEAVDFGGGGTDSASMSTTSQDIVVGDTRPGRWESDGSGDDEADGAQFSNTVAVLDKSGSMGDRDTVSGDQRITVAKQSARSLVDFVGNNNQLGVVAFDGNARTVSRLQPLTDDNRDAIKNDVDDLSSYGNTSISAGLREALGMLRQTDGSKSIILLSDGESSFPTQVLSELKSLGVTIYTIGMGSSADEQLLRRLANETGGQTAFRPQPGQIRQVFQSFSISAQNRSKLTSKRAELTEGDTVSGSATVDGSCDEVQFSLTYPGSRITLQPETPDGELLSESDSVSRRVGETSEIWTVESPQTGDWSFTMTGEQLDRPEMATTEVSADSPIDAELFVNDFHYEQTGMYRVELKATNGSERYTGAQVTLQAQNGETTEEIDLRDDRGGPDPVGDDGIYTGYFHPKETGEYRFTAQISGGNVGELQRDFTRQLTVDEVVDPIRPYEEREPIQPTETPEQVESSVGLFGLLEQYGPVGGVALAAVVLIGALARRFGGGSADDPDEGAEEGTDGDPPEE